MAFRLDFDDGSVVRVPVEVARERSQLLDEVMETTGEEALRLSGACSTTFGHALTAMLGPAEPRLSSRECERLLDLRDFLQVSLLPCNTTRDVVARLLTDVADGYLPDARTYRSLFALNAGGTFDAVKERSTRSYAAGALDQSHVAEAVAVLGPEYAYAFQPHQFPHYGAGTATPVFLLDPFEARRAPWFSDADDRILEFEAPVVAAPGLVSAEVAAARLEKLPLEGLPWRQQPEEDDHGGHGGHGGVVLAGGWASLAICGNFEAHAASSDLDLFVWGPTLEARRAAFRATVRWLVARGATLEACGSVLRASVAGLPEVQVINSDARSVEAVLANFDCSHAQVGWTGDRWVASPEFCHFAPHGVSLLVRSTVRYPRLLKLHARGWTLAMRQSCARIARAPGLRLAPGYPLLVLDLVGSSVVCAKRVARHLTDATPAAVGKLLWRLWGELEEDESAHLAVSDLPTHAGFTAATLSPLPSPVAWSPTDLDRALALAESGAFRNSMSCYAGDEDDDSALFLRDCRVLSAQLSPLRRRAPIKGRNDAEFLKLRGTPTGSCADPHAPVSPGKGRPAVELTVRVWQDTVLDLGDQTVPVGWLLDGRPFNVALSRVPTMDGDAFDSCCFYLTGWAT